MNFEDLSPELREKAKTCKTTEDILALAQTEGHELSEDELQAISGGSWCWDTCSNNEPSDGFDCGSKVIWG